MNTKKIAAMLVLVLCTYYLPVAIAADCTGKMTNVVAKRLMGPSENLCEAHPGKVMLVVNTARKCGFTKQYAGLEKLYQQYKDRGLVVVGFPSDNFAHQEYDSETEINEFCKLNFGVSFPMYGKVDVIGDTAHPLFKSVSIASNTIPKWNFYKYLIGRDGKTVNAFSSFTTPDDPELQAAIENALKTRE